ncbi:alpha/beta-hydrolase [Cadophora sp. DSE1049]|nr:alpha/beta-hydrolase [Cadophora sp. DSE1049]
MATHPEPYVRLPVAAHKTTLILLHGTSQTGPKFAESFLPTLFSPPRDSLVTSSTSRVSHEKVSLPEYFPSCKFVFPTGASRRTTVFGGKETNAWFDITDFGDRTKGEMDMLEGMRESSLYLANLVRNEIELLDGEGEKGNERDGNVIIAGFSQGSAMGLILLLGGELQRQGLVGRLGAFAGLSGWLPFRRQIEEIISRESVGLSDGGGVATMRNATTNYVRELLGLECAGDKWHPGSEFLGIPVFLGHGELDVKMKFEWGLQLRDTLEQLEMEVEFRSYVGLEHWWNEQEMTDIARFLYQTLQSSR